MEGKNVKNDAAKRRVERIKSRCPSLRIRWMLRRRDRKTTSRDCQEKRNLVEGAKMFSWSGEGERRLRILGVNCGSLNMVLGNLE